MWYTEVGKDGDVVLSSRVRLARNIKDIPFGNRMTEAHQDEVISRCKNALSDMKFISLEEMSDVEKTSLAERHLISLDMIENNRKKGLLHNDECTVSVMLGEEDHIRIQAMKSGFCLDWCLDEANKVDDRLEESVEYGFSEKFGYLTCCPTNVGTGMRASVMLQLPALVMSGRMEGITSSLLKLGMTVRGIYGEGSKAIGDIFQISNQVTLGQTEEEIIQKLKQIVAEVVQKERETAKSLYEKNKYVLEDKVMRSYGMLKNAVILSSKEAMSALSDIRLGINLGIIKDISEERIISIIYAIQPASLIKENNIVSVSDRDIKRAEVVKSMLV